MTTVRAATSADASAVAQLLAELGYPTPPDVVPARIDAIEANGGIVLVAVDAANAVVGLASGAHIPTLHAGGHVAYITSLVTFAELRGRGVGRALVAELERRAREQGCSRLSVTSAEHRADAHAFYPRCGLPLSGRRFTKRLDATE